jgi:hypothetical protein
MIPPGGVSLKVSVPKVGIYGYTSLVTLGVCGAKVEVAF